MRRIALASLALVIACSGETPTPAPPEPHSASPSNTPAPAATATTPVPVATPVDRASYDAAMIWLRSTPGFRFTLKEEGITATGEMKRPTVGAEQVTFRAGGAEWRGEAKLRGVVWTTRRGGTWVEAPPPPYAGRLYQRVTLAFDPRKKEGAAQLAASDASTNVYRFTDSNTGRTHEVHVRKADASVRTIRIGNDVELTVEP